MFRVAAVASVLVALGACHPLTDAPGTGKTSVYLTDSPFPFHMIDRVDIKVVRVEATATADTTVNQSWTTIAEVNRSINLLELHSGSTALLGETELPAGQYRAVRMTINTAESSVVGIDGTVWPVSWGIHGLMSMYAVVEAPLPVGSGTNRIVIDFDVGRSFQLFGSGLVFIPWLRAVNEAATGTISGVITAGTAATAFPNAVVSALNASDPTRSRRWVVATGRTDANGRYTVAFLPEGNYQLKVEGPNTIEGEPGPCKTVEPVQVRAGAATTVNANLLLDAAACGDIDPDTGGTGGQATGGAVASVSVSLAPAPGGSVTVGDSLGLSAVLKDDQGVTLYGRKVTWGTSNASVLQVYGFGPYAISRALAAGTASVTATSEGKSGSVTVQVQ